MTHVKTIGLLSFLLLISGGAFSQIGYKKIGMASFYHDKFNGRKTASGEIFSQKKMTCAHRTFPMGTRLKVTNIDNGKSVLVRVNDRGPYAKSRMIDLTSAAAQKLGFVHDGEVIVQIEIVSSEGSADSLYITTDSLKPFYKMEALPEGAKYFSIKIGSYLLVEKMLEMTGQLKKQTGLEVFVQTVPFNKDILYRVFAGRFPLKEQAREQRDKILPYFPDCYVVEMKE